MGIVYVVLALVAAFLVMLIGMRFFIQFKSAAMKGKTAPDPGGKAGKIVRSGKSALFYFYSPSCGACRAMTPVIKNLSRDRDNIFAIDISSDMATARKFGVMATPTLVVVKDKLVSNILIGPQSPLTIEGQLN